MKVIILAAGRGSRMHEGTANNPKCMMTVGGKSLIGRCLETLHAAQINNEDISIVTGYKSELLRNEFPSVHYFHNDLWEQTNMVYSLTQAKEWLESEDCIVVYSDIIFSPDVISRIASVDGDIVLPYYTGYVDLWQQRFDNPLEDLETFRMDSHGYLEEIGSHPISFTQVQGQFMGIVKFTPRGWGEFISSVVCSPKPLEKTDMTTMLNSTIVSNHLIKCIKCDELWLECDNQNDIRIYEDRYKEDLA